jgi:hypothetical protein
MTRDVVKPRFEDAQVVMICHHLYERATRGLLSIPWHSVRWERFTPAKLFTREDGTEGKCDFTVWCWRCQKLPPTKVDYIEEVWSGGHLYVADFLRSK